MKNINRKIERKEKNYNQLGEDAKGQTAHFTTKFLTSFPKEKSPRLSEQVMLVVRTSQ